MIVPSEKLGNDTKDTLLVSNSFETLVINFEATDNLEHVEGVSSY